MRLQVTHFAAQIEVDLTDWKHYIKYCNVQIIICVSLIAITEMQFK